MEKQVQCPNCKSFKVKVESKKSKMTSGLSLLVLGGLLVLIGNNVTESMMVVLSWVFGYSLLFIGLAYVVMAIAHKADKATCRSCKMTFSPAPVSE